MVSAFALNVVGVVVYRSQSAELQRTAGENLAAIARLKSRSIADWANERRGDAVILGGYLSAQPDLAPWLKAGAPHDIRAARVLDRLSSLRTYGAYRDVALTDSGGRLLLSATGDTGGLDAAAALAARQAADLRQTLTSDVHQSSAGPEATELHIFQPVLASAGPGAPVVGVVVLTIDVNGALMPLITWWPTNSRSAETLMVERQGDSVVYINRPRLLNVAPLELRRPMSPGLPAAAAARGLEGLMTGEDYRGAPVVAAITPVSGTRWGLVAEVDVGEIQAPLQRLFLVVALVLATLVISTGLLMVAVWRRQQTVLILRRLRAEEGRRRMEERFEALSKYANDIILLTDSSGRIAEANDRALLVYGLAYGDLIGRRLQDLHPEGEPEARDGSHGVRDDDGALFEALHRRADGSLFPVEISSRRIVLDGHPWRQLIIRDITERKRNEAELLRAALFDSLTGLPNRVSFIRSVEAAIALARMGPAPFAVMVFDLDQFKDVNDTLGHPLGDQLLQRVAQRLRARIRDTDVVARFGGDEFAIVATEIHDSEGLVAQAQRLLTEISRPEALKGHDVRTTASVGVALFESRTPDAGTLLSHADIALSRAKADGRGMVRLFTPEMDMEVRQRVSLGHELRAAIEAGHLSLVYQPQADGLTGSITGFEALARWRHETYGVVSPEVFIPLSEEIGLAAPLGRWAINEACRQMRAWLDAGLAPPRVGINLSGRQFRTPGDLERDLADALATHDLAPERFELELTESVLMEASVEHNGAITHLREQGFRVAIDDFGTGFSSLDYLRRFPVDRIKIDQHFVRDIAATPGNAAIVRATIGLAEALNIEVIAEGVETVQQRDLLLAWGCRQMQGYYFAHPLSAEDATALLREGEVLPKA